MSETDFDAIIDTALTAAEPDVLEAGVVYSVVVPEGATRVNIDTEYLLAGPRRATGTANVTDSESLILFVQRNHQTGDGSPPPVLFADITRSKVTAILNGHSTAKGPGWGDLRGVLTLTTTQAWKHWTAVDRKWLTQLAFAEHIEEGLADIVAPPAAEMLELAQTLQAHNKVDFRSQTLLANGQRQFTYAETVEAKAGQKGQLDIPQAFDLGIAPYEGTDQGYRLVARLQFRIEDGNLRIRYLLTKPEDVLREAFLDVVGHVEVGVGHTALRGAWEP